MNTFPLHTIRGAIGWMDASWFTWEDFGTPKVMEVWDGEPMIKGQWGVPRSRTCTHGI